MPSADIAAIGDVAWDLTFVVERRGADEKSVVTTSHRGLGGTAANAAVAAAKLGGSVHLFATVGSDPIASIVVEALSRANVDVQGVARRDGTTATVAIVISPNDREVIVDPGVAHSFEGLDVARVLGHRLVYISVVPLQTFVSLVQGRSVHHTVIGSLEAGMLGEQGDEWMLALGALDVLILNQAAARAVVDRLGGLTSLSSPATGTGPDIVVTRGASGAELLSRDGSRTVYPAIGVEPVDATGAGDCFGGALAHFLLKGRALPDAVRLANVAAGLSTVKLGAQSAFPDEPMVLRASEQHRGRGIGPHDAIAE